MVESEQYSHSSPTIVEGSPDMVYRSLHTLPGSFDNHRNGYIYNKPLTLSKNSLRIDLGSSKISKFLGEHACPQTPLVASAFWTEVLAHAVPWHRLYSDYASAQLSLAAIINWICGSRKATTWNMLQEVAEKISLGLKYLTANSFPHNVHH